MSRIVGICIPFGNEERFNKIRKTASDYGFDVQIYEYGKVTEEQLDKCEVYFGLANSNYINNSRCLKWIQLSFAGSENYVNIERLKNKEIILTNSSGAFGITMSEHIIMVLLMLMRRMPEYSVMNERRELFVVGEIKSIINSNICVVGMGDIGSNFAKRAKALGANIISVRRNINNIPEFVDKMYSIDKLKQAVRDADAVVLCLPETKETKRIIGKEEFENFKKGSFIINVGRGSAINHDELVVQLQNGHIGGAALDVTYPEPLPKNHPLWNCKNVIITPHISGNTALPLTCDIMVDMFCENLVKYANGEQLNNIVNCSLGY